MQCNYLFKHNNKTVANTKKCYKVLNMALQTYKISPLIILKSQIADSVLKVNFFMTEIYIYQVLVYKTFRSH